jgi:hypothetical protein
MKLHEDVKVPVGECPKCKREVEVVKGEHGLKFHSTREGNQCEAVVNGERVRREAANGLTKMVWRSRIPRQPNDGDDF